MRRTERVLQQAIWFEKLAQELPLEEKVETPSEPLGTFYRVNTKGKNLMTHQSGLAYEKVPGVFAFDRPEQLFDTYTWLHVKKNIDRYQMITFLGKEVERPTDSEGVVVQPVQILNSVPLKEFIRPYLD